MKRRNDKRSKHCCLLVLVGFLMMCMTGCSSVKMQNVLHNVEQRDYATILIVANGKEEKNYKFSLGIASGKKVGEKSQTEKVSTFEADNFEELKKLYRSTKGKELSLTHLKVILLAREQNRILESQWEILNEMDEDAEIAKTCPVLQIEDEKKFLDYLENAKEPVGTYIDNLIHTKEGEDVPWLKDYLKVLREGSMLQVYFLESVSEGWQIKCRAEVRFSKV